MSPFNMPMSSVMQADGNSLALYTGTFLHIIRGKICRKRKREGRGVCELTRPPGEKSNCSVTPAPCHHDTGSNFPPEDFTADRRSLKSYVSKISKNISIPHLEKMILGSSRIDRNKEEKWEHTSPSLNNSGNRPD